MTYKHLITRVVFLKQYLIFYVKYRTRKSTKGQYLKQPSEVLRAPAEGLTINLLQGEQTYDFI